jgi:hypothetical protein
MGTSDTLQVGYPEMEVSDLGLDLGKKIVCFTHHQEKLSKRDKERGTPSLSEDDVALEKMDNRLVATLNDACSKEKRKK